MIFDVAIVGGGPAGSTCAALCAAGGRTTLLLERSRFPREKVCGDCLNPGCWPVLDRLNLSERVLGAPHARLRKVEFIGLEGESVCIPLPMSSRGEIAIKRSVLDQLLLDRARELGAVVREEAAVTVLERGWRIQTSNEMFCARNLVAADGRNSTVARLLGLLPAGTKKRIGVQIHARAPDKIAENVTLHFLPHGYCGVAPVGGGEINVCLVTGPRRITEAKAWVSRHFAISPRETWRTITPLTRGPVRAREEKLVFVGDAARLVEPFTGEGIYYALASGELAADCILTDQLAAFPVRHRALYRGRLWINQLARLASQHPRAATQIVRMCAHAPRLLSMLTQRIVAPG